MSYSYDGSCYVNTQDALGSVIKSFPKWSSNGFTTISNASISDSGLVTLNVTLGTGATSVNTFSLSSPCVPYSSTSFIAAVLFCFILGWGTKRVIGVLGFLTDAGKLD